LIRRWRSGRFRPCGTLRFVNPLGVGGVWEILVTHEAPQDINVRDPLRRIESITELKREF